MMDKFKDNTGVLFKNDKKLSDNHPDYKGSITVGGVEYWISSWIKQGRTASSWAWRLLQKKRQHQSLLRVCQWATWKTIQCLFKC